MTVRELMRHIYDEDMKIYISYQDHSRGGWAGDKHALLLRHADTEVGWWKIDYGDFYIELSPRKTCPRCGQELLQDMDVCYGCLYDFTREER